MGDVVSSLDGGATEETVVVNDEFGGGVIPCVVGASAAMGVAVGLLDGPAVANGAVKGSLNGVNESERTLVLCVVGAMVTVGAILCLLDVPALARGAVIVDPELVADPVGA